MEASAPQQPAWLALNALSSPADLYLAAHPDQYYGWLNSRLFDNRKTNLTQCRYRLKKSQGGALPSFLISEFEPIFSPFESDTFLSAASPAISCPGAMEHGRDARATQG
jgi:hypothetical protein